MKNEKAKKAAAAVCVLSAVFVVAFLVTADIFHKPLRETDKYSVAMGTVITQRLFSRSDASKECADIDEIINTLENKISWRKEGSPIYSLNKNNTAGCDEELSEIFSRSKAVYDASSGAFDITVGSLTTLWNIGEETARVPDENEIASALSFVDGSKINVSDGVVTSGKGQLVDLGAVGKGLACDKVREYLEETDINGAVISVGGSVLLYGENEETETWSVGVRDPRGESDEYMGVLSVSYCCVSTSGDYERVLRKDEKTYHHILDPKTGYPSDSSLISVTVVSSSGFMSDALSTACFVLGREKGERLLSMFDAEGVFIDSEKNVFVTPGLKASFTLTSDKYVLSGEAQ